MSVLILQNTPSEGPGTIEDFLREKGIPHTTIDLQKETVPDPSGFDTLVMLGGPMSANDTDRHPFLADTMHLIRAFAADDRPVLGVCLGAQIIARAFGGEVYRMARLESCFRTMTVTPEGAHDPVFSALGSEITSFQNHFEAVRDVPNAVPLATGGACPVQAVRIGRATYATQFHPEKSQLAGMKLLETFLAL